MCTSYRKSASNSAHTVPGNVKEMSNFPGVGNVHNMNGKFELSYTFLGIFWPRKFKISFSVRIWHCMFLQDLEDLDTARSYKILQDLAGLQEKGPFLVRSCKSVFTGYFVIQAALNLVSFPPL